MAARLEGAANRERDVALLRRVGALDDAAGDELLEGEAADREHTRQLLAVNRLIIEYVERRPTVILIDDIDWADTATIELLRHLLFRLADREVSLVVIATSRADPAARAGAGIARLRSEPRVATMYLHPLSGLEATELARQLEPDRTVDHARVLAEAGNGNQLLIEALSQQARRGLLPDPFASAGSGLRASHPVTDAIATRLLTLSDAGRTVARAAAFLQPDCHRDLLLAVAQLDGPTLDAALDDVIEHGVLLDDEPLHFTHPLFAHTLIDQTSAPARREIHARIAEILLARRAGGEAVESRALAHHLIGAGDRGAPAVVAAEARRAGDEAMALTVWNEAARCYEAAIQASRDASAEERATLHRSAGLAHRGDMEMKSAVKHFATAVDLLGPDGDPAALAELHIWRIRCGVGSRDVLDAARDRAPLEALIDVVAEQNPELAAEALVELAQSYWIDWEMGRSADTARRAMAMASEQGNHRAFVRAATTLSVPQWAAYVIAESLATLERGIERARAADDDTVLVGGPLFRAPLVLTWMGRFAEAEELAREGLEVAERTHYPLEEGLPLSALAQIAVARGAFADTEQYAHQALLVQRLSGYHWAAGLFLLALASAHLARGRYEAAHHTLDIWSETGDAMEQATLALFRRLVNTRERGQAVQGDALPGLGRHPVIGADAWAAASVEIARWEGPTADVRGARDLLAEIERRGGLFASSYVALVPRVLGVAQSLSGEDDDAIVSLQRAIRIADGLGASAEGARASRPGHRLDPAGRPARGPCTCRPGGRDSRSTRHGARRRGRDHAGRLGGTPVGCPRLPATDATAVILFSDVVDSTRLTEELGAPGYRMRAREVEALVTSAIVAHGGTVVSGISLGDGFIGLFSAIGPAVRAARECARDVGTTGLHLHLAVHRGDILIDGTRIYGGPVNYAARMCALSGPDEILVSENGARRCDVRGARRCGLCRPRPAHVQGLRRPANRLRRGGDSGPTRRGIAFVPEVSCGQRGRTRRDLDMGSMPSWFAKTKEMAAFDRYFSLIDVDANGLLDRYYAALKRLDEQAYYRSSEALTTQWKGLANSSFAISGSLDAHFRGDWIHRKFDPRNPSRFDDVGGRFWPQVNSFDVINTLRAGTMMAIYKAMGDTALEQYGLSRQDRFELWKAERENGIDIDDGVRGIALSWNCVAPAGDDYFDAEALRGPSVVELAIATLRPYGFATISGISHEARNRLVPAPTVIDESTESD